MVKPRKIMEPGHMESPSHKNPHRGMGGDSFRHYMARKIELQRQQFGNLSPERFLPANPHFFRDVVCLVNGYTNPDATTLQRLLHRFGGDLEKYETLRITHILAEHLSFAKAQIYKRQRKPVPVVKPQWILDCVAKQKLLPHGPYLLSEIKGVNTITVRSFFGLNTKRTESRPAKNAKQPPVHDSGGQGQPFSRKRPRHALSKEDDAAESWGLGARQEDELDSESSLRSRDKADTPVKRIGLGLTGSWKDCSRREHKNILKSKGLAKEFEVLGVSDSNGSHSRVPLCRSNDRAGEALHQNSLSTIAKRPSAVGILPTTPRKQQRTRKLKSRPTEPKEEVPRAYRNLSMRGMSDPTAEQSKQNDQKEPKELARPKTRRPLMRMELELEPVSEDELTQAVAKFLEFKARRRKKRKKRESSANKDSSKSTDTKRDQQHGPQQLCHNHNELTHRPPQKIMPKAMTNPYSRIVRFSDDKTTKANTAPLAIQGQRKIHNLVDLPSRKLSSLVKNPYKSRARIPSAKSKSLPMDELISSEEHNTIFEAAGGAQFTSSMRRKKTGISSIPTGEGGSDNERQLARGEHSLAAPATWIHTKENEGESSNSGFEYHGRTRNVFVEHLSTSQKAEATIQPDAPVGLYTEVCKNDLLDLQVREIAQDEHTGSNRKDKESAKRLVNELPRHQSNQSSADHGNEVIEVVTDAVEFLSWRSTTAQKSKEKVGNGSSSDDDVDTFDSNGCIYSQKNRMGQSTFYDPREAPKEDGRTDSKYINGRVRTTGTDPNFLEAFFSHSRLSFIGSFKQRARPSPVQDVPTVRSSKSKRYIFHIDMDCFFASVVLRNYPKHQGKPVAISHCGKSDGSDVEKVFRGSTSECATCNYEARKYGIKKGMFLGKARELCPDLIILKYDFEGYEEVTEQVTEILHRSSLLHDGTVERVSCDEAYMELHCESDTQAREIAEMIRNEIVETTQCTASVGVGANKFLARLATEKVKPNGCHVVSEFDGLLEPLKLRDLHGIGRRSERKLMESNLLTVKDVWDLGDQAEGELCRILGSGLGKKIHNFCRREDDREVKPVERKTIGAACNYGVRFDGPYGLDYLIGGLAKEVEKRMEGAGVKGSKITLKVKQRKPGAKLPPKFLGHGSCFNLSKSVDLPGGSLTSKHSILAHFGLELFKVMSVDLAEVRGMGITMSKLVHTDSESYDSSAPISKRITSFFQASEEGKLDEKTGSHSIYTVGQDERANRFELREDKNGVVTAVCSQCSMAAMDEDLTVQIKENVEPNSESNKVFEARTDQGPADDNLLDAIDLPALSQIRMSQVDEMPEKLKHHIKSKLEARDRVLGEKSAETRVEVSLVPEQSKLLQTNLKEMFQLAAVKSGENELKEALGESISLTQLACLPLEVQLQVAGTATAKTNAVATADISTKWTRRSHKQVSFTHLNPVENRFEDAAWGSNETLGHGQTDEGPPCDENGGEISHNYRSPEIGSRLFYSSRRGREA